MIVNAFRFFIDHRLGRVDKSGHGKPEALGAVQDAWLGQAPRTGSCKRNAHAVELCTVRRHAMHTGSDWYR
ncbi:hypothetical protein J2S67_001260 [Pseudoglutamicibacter albus]|uniref:Uncharacterized protein n=1 Tax=Pseudoglutamicibacter albus TaxID=98671 RepID=A0ABU1Z055_9MICC|nr:hypothetical protein [Pseudoglutamicibacter albus]